MFITLLDMRVDGLAVTSSSLLGSYKRRRITGSTLAAFDFRLSNKAEVRSFTLQHSQNGYFSGYLMGVGDRESYCIPIGPNLHP